MAVLEQGHYTEGALIPKDRYISQDWLQAEFDRLWPRVWQMACRLEEIPDPGDYVEYSVGQQSVVVVRGEGDSVRAFRNACLHRGTRLCEGSGSLLGEIRCPFHGWAWNLDGSISEVPDADDFAPECVSRQDLRLPEANVGTWGGFVFVNLSDDPDPLLDFLGPVVAGLAPFEVEKMRLIRYRTTIMQCNWKVGLAAFNEAYHVEATHAWDLSGYARRVTNGKGVPRINPSGRRLGKPGDSTQPTQRVNVRDAAGRTPGAYQFLYETFDVHNMMRNIPTLLTESATLGEMGHPKQAALGLLKQAQTISLAHQDDIDFVEALSDDEVPSDLPALQFLTQVRRAVGASRGVDYSHIPDQDMLSAIDYCIYPNMVGPINAGNWILFRFRPNGKDPDTCLYDVMFLHRFGDGEDVPPVEHEFYADWETHDGWGPIIGQDLCNMKLVQSGLHESSFKALRLNRQEAGVRHHDRFIERVMSE